MLRRGRLRRDWDWDGRELAMRFPPVSAVCDVVATGGTGALAGASGDLGECRDADRLIGGTDRGSRTGMNAITRSFTGRKRIRKSFGRIPEVAPMPNLIDVQRASYEAFLQMDVAARQPHAAPACRKCSSRSSRSTISPAAAGWSSSTTSSRSRNTTSRNASSAA